MMTFRVRNGKKEGGELWNLIPIDSLIQTFPGQLLEPNYTDPENPDRLVGRSEVERREQYFQLLDRRIVDGQRHPCVQLTKECLHNSPSRRPTAEQLVATLERMRADIEGPCGTVARADAVRQVRLNFREREWEGGIGTCMCFNSPLFPGPLFFFLPCILVVILCYPPPTPTRTFPLNEYCIARIFRAVQVSRLSTKTVKIEPLKN